METLSCFRIKTFLILRHFCRKISHKKKTPTEQVKIALCEITGTYNTCDSEYCNVTTSLQVLFRWIIYKWVSYIKPEMLKIQMITLLQENLSLKNLHKIK